MLGLIAIFMQKFSWSNVWWLWFLLFLISREFMGIMDHSCITMDMDMHLMAHIHQSIPQFQLLDVMVSFMGLRTTSVQSHPFQQNLPLCTRAHTLHGHLDMQSHYHISSFLIFHILISKFNFPKFQFSNLIFKASIFKWFFKILILNLIYKTLIFK